MKVGNSHHAHKKPPIIMKVHIVRVKKLCLFFVFSASSLSEGADSGRGACTADLVVSAFGFTSSCLTVYVVDVGSSAGSIVDEDMGTEIGSTSGSSLLFFSVVLFNEGPEFSAARGTGVMAG